MSALRAQRVRVFHNEPLYGKARVMTVWNHLQRCVLPGPVETEGDAHDSVLCLHKMWKQLHGPSAT